MQHLEGSGTPVLYIGRMVLKEHIKIYIKTAPTCFGLITIIREHIIRAC